MNGRLLVALAFTLAWEGGYVDNPDDHGGPTNRGVTTKTYNAYRTRKGLPLRDVRELEEEELQEIYRDGYWQAARCGDLPAPLDLVTFDAAVNSGPTQATRWFQEAVGAKPDGVFGPRTLDAVWSTDPRAAATAAIGAREAFLRNLGRRPGQAQFLRGWVRRTAALRVACGLSPGR